MNKYFVYILALAAAASLLSVNPGPGMTRANVVSATLFNGPSNFPLLANYYLEPDISVQDQEKLADFDLVILDMEAQHNYPALFASLRQKNPQIKIFAYVPVQHLSAAGDDPKYLLRNKLARGFSDAWYLLDTAGKRISVWPNTNLVNMTTEWKDYLPRFVAENVVSTGLWDGVFFDGIEERISFVNQGNIDLDRDGVGDEPDEADWWWKNDTIKFLRTARAALGQTLILANTRDFYAPYLNGVLFENFANWPGYLWPENFARYQRALEQTLPPHLVVINGNTADTGFKDDFRRVRWGLTSTLLSDGYFSFDYGPRKHGQTWWYDEYSVSLGKPHGPAYPVFGSFRQDQDNFDQGMDRHYLYRESSDSAFIASRVKGPGAMSGYSIRVAAPGDIKWNEFLRSDPSLLPLRPLVGYQIKLNYKILQPSSAGYFYFGARSLASSESSQQQLASWNGPLGQIGQVSAIFTPTTSDFYIFYGIKRDGAIVIDEIEIKELTGSVWRRDFDRGSVIVNSSFDSHSLNLERAYKKLDGQILTNLTVPTEDGIIMTRPPQILVQPVKKTFQGIKILDWQGNRLGVLAIPNYQIQAKRKWLADLDNDGFKEKIDIINHRGLQKIRIITRGGKLLTNLIAPFGAYRGKVNAAVGDVNGDGFMELLVTKTEGPPLVKVFSRHGQELTSFMAFDKEEYAGGINIEVQE